MLGCTINLLDETLDEETALFYYDEYVNIIFVGIGGFIGAVLRYCVSLLPLPSVHDFPYLTLLVNVVGAFVLGCLVAWQTGHVIDPRLLLVMKVGVCGGFTTFSTFSAEAFDLFTNGKTLMAVLYVCASVVLSVCAVWLPQRYM
ncbi:MAG: fluoride efflux transporter CrcB [Actinomycetaceae bacterium]|nr:fluoride efflux transporter CrcB [Actinomycetaceae bacterium]